MEKLMGYKVTELGVIPEDWEVTLVLDVTSDHKQGFYTKDKYVIDGTRLVRITDLYNPQIDYDSMPLLKISQNDFEQYKIKKGDFLFARSGAIGRYGIVKDDIEAIFGSYIIRFNFDKSQLSNEFFGYLFETSIIWKQLLAITQGSSNININAGNIKSLKIPVPPLPEQKAIAAALSDVDALIAAQEALIAKKRDIKTATMQQLLTGKVRLGAFGQRAGASGGQPEAGVQPGYQQTELGVIPEDWNLTTLGNVVDKIVGGGTPSRSNSAYWGNEIPWVTVKDFATFNSQSAQEYISSLGLQNSSSNLIPQGTLITSTRMALGKAIIYDVDVAINQDLKAIFPKRLLDTKFLYFWFQQNAEFLEALGNGSTVMGLSLIDLKNTKFLLPPLPEQQAIAEVLSDMDAEITALEAQRDKTRALKQGMMQELLTGKTRLVGAAS